MGVRAFTQDAGAQDEPTAARNTSEFLETNQGP